MTGIIQLMNGLRITAVFLYFFISHAASKGEATVMHELSARIPQYFESYTEDLNSIPDTLLDGSLLSVFDNGQDSIALQDDNIISSPKVIKRSEFVPKITNGQFQPFLKLIPREQSGWQDISRRDDSQEERLEDDRFTISDSKQNMKRVVNDYEQRSEKKSIKLLLHKARLSANQLNKRLSSRNLAYKRWWGYYRPRPKMDRRALKSKHYVCLKQCIGAGKLHPIQCHTLC